MNTNCALCAASGVETAGVLEVRPRAGWLGNLWKPGQTAWLCAGCAAQVAESEPTSPEDQDMQAQARAWVEAQDRLPCEVRGPDGAWIAGELTTASSASSYGKPVLLVGEDRLPHGPADLELGGYGEIRVDEPRHPMAERARRAGFDVEEV